MYIAAVHPQRARVSSIFQKGNNQDDVDAEMLKHVQFAAQRNSFAGTATAAYAKPETSLAGSHMLAQPEPLALQHKLQQSEPGSSQANPAVQQSPAHKQQTAVSEVKASVPTDAADTASPEIQGFTLAMIEQSIADIEAELGWISEPTAPALAPIPNARPASAAKLSSMAGGFACWYIGCIWPQLAASDMKIR